MTNPSKKGKIKSSFFQMPSSIYNGDPYIEYNKREFLEKNKKYRAGKYHEN